MDETFETQLKTMGFIFFFFCGVTLLANHIMYDYFLFLFLFLFGNIFILRQILLVWLELWKQ